MELYAAVARLVSKDEVSRDPPRAPGGPWDKEWNKTLIPGSLGPEQSPRMSADRPRRLEAGGETVHLGRIFEACYEKGSELSHDDPQTQVQGAHSVPREQRGMMKNWDHGIVCGDGFVPPHQWRLPRCSMPMGSQPGFSKQQADAVPGIRPRPSSRAPLRGVLPCRAIGGRKIGRRSTGIRWCPLILALYGHPDSGGLWEQHLNQELGKRRVETGAA